MNGDLKNEGARQPEDASFKGTEDLKSIRTFEYDAAEMLKAGKVSMTSIAAAEAERPRQLNSDQSETDTSGRNKLFLATSGILVLAGIVVFGAYFFLKPDAPPDQPVIAGKPVINIDAERKIDLTNLSPKKTISAIIANLESTRIKLNGISALVLFEKTPEGAERIWTSTDFFSKVAPLAPQPLVRSLEKSFFLGTFNYDGNQTVFIFKTQSFPQTFGGMLDWEKDLTSELGPIVALGIENSNNSSTSTDKISVINSSFSNIVIDNIDAREWSDSEGRTLMLYSFPDTKTLIITTDKKTFSAILGKLKTAKLIQ